MLKKILVCVIISAIIIAIPLWLHYSHSSAETKTISVVIDPGHGGMDSGALSPEGVMEKDISLAISLKLRDTLKKDAHKVIMTRERDEGLYGSINGSIRTKKSLDMRERKRIIDESGADFAVSIHLNSFPQDKGVYGAQCFFPSSDKTSERLAKAVQAHLEKNIDDGRTREAMGKADLYLFTNTHIPTIIVECGFLSNSDEAEALQTSKYQHILAESIYQGLMENIEFLH